MAALVITAADVKAGSQALIEYKGVAGEALTRGKYVYMLSGKLMLASNATLASADVVGVVLNDAALDQPVAYAKEGDNFEPGASGMTFPATYYLGESGEAVPVADVVSGDYSTPLFSTKSGTEAVLCIKPTGQAVS